MNGFLPIPVQAVHYSVKAENEKDEVWNWLPVSRFLFLPRFISFHFISFHPLHHPRDHFWTCLLRKSTNMRHGENTHHSASFIHVTCILNELATIPLALAWLCAAAVAAAGVMRGRLSHVANSSSLLQVVAPGFVRTALKLSVQ